MLYCGLHHDCTTFPDFGANCRMPSGRRRSSAWTISPSARASRGHTLLEPVERPDFLEQANPALVTEDRENASRSENRNRARLLSFPRANLFGRDLKWQRFGVGGMVSFYNEQVDAILIDGKEVPKPRARRQ